LYLLALVITLLLGWRTPAVVLAVIGVLLMLLGLWNPDPNRHRRADRPRSAQGEQRNA